MNALVTLAVHFITEYKKADSPVNIAMQDPDVSAIVSTATIIKRFVFKYFNNFTILGLCFQNRFILLFKENT